MSLTINFSNATMNSCDSEEDYNWDMATQTGTAYVDNFEYNTYQEEGSPFYIGLNRIYNTEGYAENVASTPNYYYYRKDHLGNNREVWFANTGETVQRTQYYPCGLPWAEGLNPGLQQRKYNGKEFVEMSGYDTYDYGFRGYYSAIMRFNRIDPMSEKYYSISPYSYAANNPISNIDFNGLFPKSILIYDSNLGLNGGYHFSQSAAYLLSLVSGVNIFYIQNAIIQERSPGQYRPFYNSYKGGGAITLGSSSYQATITYTQNYFSDDPKAYNNNGYGQNIYEWLAISSHEVGHLPQIDQEGGILNYIGEMIKQYANSGHDDAPLEKEADEGYKTFDKFNSFINKTYDSEALTKLFSYTGRESKKIETIRSWWNAYQSTLEKATESFIGNVHSLEQGKYIWDGSHWAEQ